MRYTGIVLALLLAGCVAKHLKLQDPTSLRAPNKRGLTP